MISIEGLKIISDFNEVNFRELKELDQLLIIEKKYVDGEDISYTNNELLVVDSIECDMLYGISGLKNDLYFYQVNTTDDEVKFNNIHYGSSRINDYYLVFEHKENESISHKCSLVASYKTMDENENLRYLKEKLDVISCHSFRTFSRVYYDDDEYCLFSSKCIVYRSQSGYICLELTDEIYKNIFEWNKLHKIYIMDDSLERCCQIDMELDDVFDMFKEVSKLHYNNRVYESIEKEIKDIFKYTLEECIFNAGKQEQLTDYIFGYSYIFDIGNKFYRYELRDFFKPIYTNEEYGFSAYKKSFDYDIFTKVICDKNIDPEILKKLKSIANLIIKYKTGKSRLNPYTGRVYDIYKTEEVYNDGEYIVLKDIETPLRNLTYNKFLESFNRVLGGISLYKKCLDSYIEINRIDCEEERDKVQEIFSNIEIANKIQGY